MFSLPNSLSWPKGSPIEAAACTEPVFPPSANLLVPAPNLGNAPKFNLSISFEPPKAFTVFLFNTYSPSSSIAGLTSPVLPASLIYIPAWAWITPPFCLNPAKPIAPLTIWLAACWNIAFWIAFKNPPAIPIKASPRSSVLLMAASIASTRPSLKFITTMLPRSDSKVSISDLILSRAFPAPVTNLPLFSLSLSAWFWRSLSVVCFCKIERFAFSIAKTFVLWRGIFSSILANSFLLCSVALPIFSMSNNSFFCSIKTCNFFLSPCSWSLKYWIGSFILDKSSLWKSPPLAVSFFNSSLANLVCIWFSYIKLEALLDE